MCGRFIQAQSAEQYARYLRLASLESGQCQSDSRFNIAPGSDIMAFLFDGTPRCEMLRWGLVPSWADGPDNRYAMFNARAESLHERKAFRQAFSQRRCLIPADGFYEWHTECHGRQPYLIHSAQQQPLFFAGLWERWLRDEQIIHSCTIVVTEANATVSTIHDRMPVMLQGAGIQRWLDPDSSIATLQSLFAPLDNDLRLTPVSTRVNDPRNDDPSLTQPVPPQTLSIDDLFSQ